MNKNVILTCAVTGSGDSHLKHPNIPSTPQQIADSAIEAAKAGAAIVHLHVREADGTPSRKLEYYEETVELIRQSGVDVIINLTTGMGGDYVEHPDDPTIFGPGSDMVSPLERVNHVLKIKPEICTLDCGSFNYKTTAYLSTYAMLKESAKLITEAGVMTEIEAFELGHIWQAKELMKEGYLPSSTIFQLCMGVPFGAESTPRNLTTMIDALPQGVNWGAFGLGQDEFPMVAQAVINGGNARVGLEDNIYLGKGVFASNGQLVEKAVKLIENLGARALTAAEAREKLGLVK
ncbi:3-keto-5-aminohexanoate cleavage protein [Anaerotignum sp.]|uniref:3-keto-5-aminohexanoate cleavage protein n=1 Tax=Anaerotignum sp. TaxID=2039241 RepID=UPI0028AF2AD2|nr:3-keto-5-aminohexanoate cleavage protein [Anaerotignum sp.]